MNNYQNTPSAPPLPLDASDQHDEHQINMPSSDYIAASNSDDMHLEQTPRRKKSSRKKSRKVDDNSPIPLQEDSVTAVYTSSPDNNVAEVMDDIPPGISLRYQQEDALMRMLMANASGGSSIMGVHNTNVRMTREDDEELCRRMRDFQFAQQKRKHQYGIRQPLGIFGLYDHLSGIRTDVEWAEDAAWRRFHGEPYLSWKDFEACKHTGFNKPFFVYVTVFICTIMLFVSIIENGGFESSAVNPMFGPSAEVLIDLGAKQTDRIVNEGEFFRLFTPMFLHAGVVHYIVNMFVLWFIGRAIELSHGTLAATIIFVLTAVGGTILSAIFLPEYISVGASGGIFGLIGACIADICQHWSLLFHHRVTSDVQKQNYKKVLGWLVVDVVINCLIGLTPMVDNFTHMGGLVYGFLCGLSTLERLRPAFFGIEKSNWQKFRQGLMERLGIIVVILSIFITFILLLEEDVKDSCQWCRYFSCVPMPFWKDEEDHWWHCDDCGAVTGSGISKDGVFVKVSFTCPDGVAITRRDISDDGITSIEELTRKLPGYCRDWCENIFA